MSKVHILGAVHRTEAVFCRKVLERTDRRMLEISNYQQR